MSSAKSKTQETKREDRWFLISVASGLLLVALIFGLMTWQKRKSESATLAISSGSGLIAPKLGDFVLVERSGQSLNRDQLKGQYLVVNLVWTSCSLTCLQVNKQMEKIQSLALSHPDVRLVSFSVDPETDTPAALQKFAKRFEADQEKWLFLTGDRKSISEIAHVAFGSLEEAPLPSQSREENERSALLMNTGRIAIMDTEGRVRATFNGLKPATPEAVMNAIQSLRREKSKS